MTREKVYNGGKNKYRDAYIKINGDVFRNFANRMRDSVDAVNKNIRLGACACSIIYGFETGSELF